MTTVDVTICELGTNAVRPSSVRTTVWMRVISSAIPVTSPTVIRSPMRTGCVRLSRMPAPMFPIGTLNATPMKQRDDCARREQRPGDLLRRGKHLEHAPQDDDDDECERDLSQDDERCALERRCREAGALQALHVPVDGMREDDAKDHEDDEPDDDGHQRVPRRSDISTVRVRPRAGATAAAR